MKRKDKIEQIEDGVGSFVLVFDIPREMQTERRVINRELHRAGAEMIQQSFWRHENLKSLIEFAIRIRNLGGSASVLEEKFLF